MSECNRIETDSQVQRAKQWCQRGVGSVERWGRDRALGAQKTKCKINMLQDIHYMECSLYCIITLNGLSSIKILNLRCTPETNIAL